MAQHRGDAGGLLQSAPPGPPHQLATAIRAYEVRFARTLVTKCALAAADVGFVGDLQPTIAFPTLSAHFKRHDAPPGLPAQSFPVNGG